MEFTLKTVGILSGLFALYKIIVEVIVFRSSKRRDEYEFSKQFINDLNNESIHRLTLEKGFLALTGKTYPVEEIKLLLGSREPSSLIKERSDAARFVDFIADENRYRWKGRFKHHYVQKYGVIWYYFCYVVAASLGFISIYTKDSSVLSGFPMIFLSGPLILSAGTCVVAAENFKTARKFMDKLPEQQKDEPSH